MISEPKQGVNIRDVIPPHRMTGLFGIVDALQNGPELSVQRDFDNEKREERSRFLYEASADELSAKTLEEWETFLFEYDTGFDEFLSNPNSVLIPDDLLIQILNIMLDKKQRFFEFTFYYVLKHSKRVQEWVLENLRPDYTNELFIEDKENY